MSRLLARAVRASYLVDRAYRKFDTLRSTLVTAFAPDSFFDAYNAVAYSATDIYRPQSRSFRTDLFDWEDEAIAQFFPGPPARVLVGGAGGGREAFALVRNGYQVVAFDPAESLVSGMRSRGGSDGSLRAYRGSFADMPRLVEPGTGAVVDIEEEAEFDAAVIGWSSFSHLRTDAECIETLRRFDRVTRGPILVSYYPHPGSPATETHRGIKGWLKRRSNRHGAGVFSVQIGYYRLLRGDDVDDLIKRAGLVSVHSQHKGNWPWVIVAGRGRRT